jgi:modification methylase
LGHGRSQAIDWSHLAVNGVNSLQTRDRMPAQRKLAEKPSVEPSEEYSTLAREPIALPVISEQQLLGVLPDELQQLENPQTALPRIAKTSWLIREIDAAIAQIPTKHVIARADARVMPGLQSNSVHLVCTSPPYWTLKDYRDSDGQLGHIEDYDEFLDELDRVWQRCFDALVPGGRLICVVGDVCLSRRENNGRHTVVPLHASIQERCRRIGFDNLAPIIWHKIANAVYEVENGSSFLGKPYEPNAVIKNDIEFILMQRKPGGYRKPTTGARVLSVISEDNHRQWFQQIWSGLTGASTRSHPAPYPIELAERLIRMFSFVGDTVLDPFLGTGSTSIAAARFGRNSIGFEIDEHYFEAAEKRIRDATADLFSAVAIEARRT